MSTRMSLGRWVIEVEGRRIAEVPVSARPTKVGSVPTNDIVLEGEEVPNLAAIIRVNDAGQVHVDIIENNNPAEQVQQHEVPLGASINVGRYRMRRVDRRGKRSGEATRPIDDDGPDADSLELQLEEGSINLVPGSPVLIGRDRSNDIVLSSSAVSGFHCRLVALNGRWKVIDLSSTNGTFIDGVRLGNAQNAQLPLKGTLRLGDVVIPFDARPEAEPVEDFHGLIGSSSEMKAVFRQIEIIARNPEPVLISGETGTGKELVAHALHAASPRKKRPFIARNCGAIPESLADAELFGSVKGAFSEAVNKPGVFEGVKGGTVFLDELGELPLPIQSKLLRALQEKKVTRLGDLKEKPVEFRLVAATHRNLEGMVIDRRFREDLYHRVSVFMIELPPLRNRRADIPLLTRHLLSGSNIEISSAALDRLMSFDWPGNIRQLQNVLIRASAFRTGPSIKADDIQLPSRSLRVRPRRHGSLDDEEVRKRTTIVWEESGRSVSRAAALLGIAKSTMHGRKARYNLPDKDPY